MTTFQPIYYYVHIMLFVAGEEAESIFREFFHVRVNLLTAYTLYLLNI